MHSYTTLCCLCQSLINHGIQLILSAAFAITAFDDGGRSFYKDHNGNFEMGYKNEMNNSVLLMMGYPVYQEHPLCNGGFPLKMIC